MRADGQAADPLRSGLCRRVDGGGGRKEVADRANREDDITAAVPGRPARGAGLDSRTGLPAAGLVARAMDRGDMAAAIGRIGQRMDAAPVASPIGPAPGQGLCGRGIEDQVAPIRQRRGRFRGLGAVAHQLRVRFRGSGAVEPRLRRRPGPAHTGPPARVGGGPPPAWIGRFRQLLKSRHGVAVGLARRASGGAGSFDNRPKGRAGIDPGRRKLDPARSPEPTDKARPAIAAADGAGDDRGGLPPRLGDPRPGGLIRIAAHRPGLGHHNGCRRDAAVRGPVPASGDFPGRNAATPMQQPEIHVAHPLGARSRSAARIRPGVSAAPSAASATAAAASDGA